MLIGMQTHNLNISEAVGMAIHFLSPCHPDCPCSFRMYPSVWALVTSSFFLLIIYLKHGVHTHDWASLRRNSTVANKSAHDWTAYTITTAHSDLAILSSHLIDRKVRANSQEEVTYLKRHLPRMPTKQ